MQFQLTSPADQRLRWQAGVYFLDIERYQAVTQQRDDGSNWPNPASGVRRIVYSEFTDAMVNDTFDTQTFAVYGSMSFDVTEALELSVALRYDSEKREVTNNVPSPADGALSNYIDYCGGQCTLNGQPLNGSPLNLAS